MNGKELAALRHLCPLKNRDHPHTQPVLQLSRQLTMVALGFVCEETLLQFELFVGIRLCLIRPTLSRSLPNPLFRFVFNSRYRCGQLERGGGVFLSAGNGCLSAASSISKEKIPLHPDQSLQPAVLQQNPQNITEPADSWCPAALQQSGGPPARDAWGSGRGYLCEPPDRRYARNWPDRR